MKKVEVLRFSSTTKFFVIAPTAQLLEEGFPDTVAKELPGTQVEFFRDVPSSQEMVIVRDSDNITWMIKCSSLSIIQKYDVVNPYTTYWNHNAKKLVFSGFIPGLVKRYAVASDFHEARCMIVQSYDMTRVVRADEVNIKLVGVVNDDWTVRDIPSPETTETTNLTPVKPKKHILVYSLTKVRLDSQGYDSSGSYFGRGQPLYLYDLVYGSLNQCPTGVRIASDSDHIRANDREDAKRCVEDYVLYSIQPEARPTNFEIKFVGDKGTPLPSRQTKALLSYIRGNYLITNYPYSYTGTPQSGYCTEKIWERDLATLEKLGEVILDKKTKTFVVL
jgi:hypothetical protein